MIGRQWKVRHEIRKFMLLPDLIARLFLVKVAIIVTTRHILYNFKQL